MNALRRDVGMNALRRDVGMNALRLPLAYLGSLSLLLGRSLAPIYRRPWKPGAVLAHAVAIGNQSLFLVAPCMAFFGMVLVSHASVQAARLLGDFSLLGPDYLMLMVREFGPTLTALLVATRAGAGIAAEIGTMAVTEQIEALELCAGDPIGELVTPRLLGGALGLTSLAAIATAISSVAAALTTTFLYGANGWLFLDPRSVTWADLAAGFLKAALSGVAVPLCACRAGLRARGGPTAVGAATTAGVVQGCLAVIAIDFLVGTFFLLFT